MNDYEQDYSVLLTHVICAGEKRDTRAGPTRSIFGTILKIDCLEYGWFPVLTQRKLYPQTVWGELAAFLTGTTKLQVFRDFGCNYWDANAVPWFENHGRIPDNYTVGKIYGYQWRHFGGRYDQLRALIQELRTNPKGRRHLLTTYNPAELHEMCLPPCHLLAQFNASNFGKLDCIVTMRSVDLCLGLPNDVILYATLMLLICNEVDLQPGMLTFMMGDTHVYKNHIPVIDTQFDKPQHPLPAYSLSPKSTLNTFVPGDIALINYNHSGVLKYEFNV